MKKIELENKVSEQQRKIVNEYKPTLKSTKVADIVGLEGTIKLSDVKLLFGDDAKKEVSKLVSLHGAKMNFLASFPYLANGVLSLTTITNQNHTVFLNTALFSLLTQAKAVTLSKDGKQLSVNESQLYKFENDAITPIQITAKFKLTDEQVKNLMDKGVNVAIINSIDSEETYNQLIAN